MDEFKGDLHDYESWLQDYQSSQKAVSNTSKPSPDEIDDGQQNESAENKKERKRIAAEQRKRISPLKKRLSKAETAMEKHQAELLSLEELMAVPDIYSADNKDKLKELLDEQTVQRQALDAAEQEWFELSEEIEQAEQLL